MQILISRFNLPTGIDASTAAPPWTGYAAELEIDS
jgi:hypothetical protein